MFASTGKPEVCCCIGASNYTESALGNLVRFEYFEQGGANVIFKIHAWSCDSAQGEHAFFFIHTRNQSDRATPLRQEEVTSKVLRVNKGLEKTLQCDQVITGFYEHVHPLFRPGCIEVIAAPLRASSAPLQPQDHCVISIQLSDRDLTQHLMDHEGVMLSSDVMVDLTSKSDAIVAERVAGQSKTLTSQRWGILLPDLSSTAGSSITLEVKPKWLTQSPNAPQAPLRCRTCAMQVAKPKDATKYICPLRLVDGSPDMIQPWISARVREQLLDESKAPNEQQTKQITRITAEIVASTLR